MDRRRFLSTSALLGAASLLTGREAAAQDHGGGSGHGQGGGGGQSGTKHGATHGGGHMPSQSSASIPSIDFDPPGELDTPHTRVVTPNGATLPWKVVDGVKVFHMIAEPVEIDMVPGLRTRVWGYNGHSPGPTIEVVAGERLRIYVTNRLPEPTTVHWHGIVLPNGMDGVGGLNQPHIKAGETFRYEFTIERPGTYMYHPHVDEMTQIGLGMVGFIIVHPRTPERRVDRDFAIMLHEWKVPVGTSRPDPREMADFNMATMNHRAFPGTAPLVVRTGDRVRIRFGNLSPIDNHPIHLHGYSFEVTGTDGGPVPESARWPETSVIVPVGTARDVEFVADAPGDWAMHCHFTHHIMNQMGHGGPNMVGVDPSGLDEEAKELLPGYMTMGTDGMAAMAEHRMPVPENSQPMRGFPGAHDTIDMGGMMTVLKVRDDVEPGDYSDPGWYEQPSGTGARVATSEELAADGIDVPQ